VFVAASTEGVGRSAAIAMIEERINDFFIEYILKMYSNAFCLSCLDDVWGYCRCKF